MLKISIKGIVVLTFILLFSVSYAAEDAADTKKDENAAGGFHDEGASHKHVTANAWININTATQSEIAHMINTIINVDLCHEITKYREAHNGFKNIEELKSVPGVTEEMYKKIQEHVRLEV